MRVTRSGGGGRRARDDRGTAMIESAIILPVIVLLVFGIVEVGFLIRSASVTSAASRSGARLAAANYGSATTSAAQQTVIDNVRQTVEKDLSSRGSDDTPIALWIYDADANGNPQSGNFSSCGANCFTYTWNGTNFSGLAGSWASPTVCGPTHDSIGVYVKMSHTAIGFSAFLPANTTTQEHTVMRLEPPNTCPQGT